MPASFPSLLHAADCGHGPAVVLIPGLGGLGKFWQPVQTLLAGSFRTLAIDHPGVGRSPASAKLSIDAIARQVLDLLDSAGVERAHVIGHSTGGLIAQAMALDAAERIGKLVLSSTWARTDARFRALFQLRQQVLRTSGVAAYTELGELLAYPPQWYEQHLATPPARPAAALDTELTLARIDMLLAYERSAELARIQAPVLVIGAADDNIVPFHHAQELAHLIPQAQLVQLDGGHFSPTTQTQAYATLITDFLGAKP